MNGKTALITGGAKEICEIAGTYGVKSMALYGDMGKVRDIEA